MSFVSRNDIEIHFPKNQKLPEGYKVIWSEDTEHYHAVNESLQWDTDCCSSRFQARRFAIQHSKIGQEVKGDE